MNTMDFKVTLKCEGCVARVKPALDAEPGILAWNADVAGPAKTLHVEGEGISPGRILEILKAAGYAGEWIGPGPENA